ncbi:MAG: MerR family transcriptional regulator [Verrucomicrobia bacterium]|nr:MerR family transcriptional regulator [Verrucomicrobiota bacterium]
MTDANYPIQMVARMTGLSAHAIRIWEQRYRAVEPQRTPTKRRLYSPSDIDRLRLLREVTLAGHSIGQVARLPMDRLRVLAAASAGVGRSGAQAARAGPAHCSLLEECLAAIQALDGRGFEELLGRAGATLGIQGALQRLIAPLAQQLGELWRAGTITAAHEHFATGFLRGFLASAVRPYGGRDGAPTVVVATPAGQLHEVGALLVGAMAGNLGWRVLHLGASLPALEIAGVARQQQARAVALSLVYPEDDSKLAAELVALRAALPSETALVLGGRAAAAYQTVLDQLGARVVADLGQLGEVLDGLRKPAAPVKVQA